MRYFLIILCLPFWLFSQTPELKVSDNGRYLVTEEGEPFLWIGDTIWGLFHRTTKETAETYFAKRAEQGFNVIQACITAAGYWPGLEENVYGEKPFFMNDPAKPNDEFFEYVDWVIDKAADYGLYIGLLPTWGEYVCPAWHDGPKIFNPDNAYEYGKYIANQFGAKSNVIWILGGDRKGDQCGTEDIEIWDAMLTGLEKVDPNTLKTYHPNGDPNSSSRWFQYESRLDINMIETYKNAVKIYPFVLADYLRLPRKPVEVETPGTFEDAVLLIE